MNNVPKYSLLYVLLAPVLLIPVVVMAVLLVRGSESEQFYNRALAAAANGDFALAVKSFERAGELGHAESYYSLARIYQSGSIAIPDRDQAIYANLLKASLHGSVPAAYELGKLLLDSPEVDHAQAALYFRTAALGGHAKAQLALAELYENGKGVEQSDVLAEEFYLQAASGGDPEALTALGVFYLKERNGNIDYSKAVRYLHEASEKNYPRAFTVLGYICENKPSANKAEAEKRAGSYYRRAAELLDPEGLTNYGDHLMRDNRPQEALRCYHQAADKLDFAPAAHRLGMYFYQQKTPDHRRALHYFERAAARGYAASWMNLSIMAESGQGAKVDLKRAKECYSMAEKLGMPEAGKRLKILAE